MLFSLGNAMSGPPTNRGSRKLPNPPIIAGITIKKIIKMACAVIILLYNWLSAMYCTPGPDNSSLIKTEKAVPSKPEKRENIRYSVPMSLALLDKNHLSNQRVIFDSLSSKLLPFDSNFIAYVVLIEEVILCR
jgi:hypothetical protein